MTIYYGVVRNRVVILPEDVPLTDGTRVEVRVSDVSEREDERQHEEQFKQELLKAGLLAEIKHPIDQADYGDRNLIQVKGKPLSETIIDERR